MEIRQMPKTLSSLITVGDKTIPSVNSIYGIAKWRKGLFLTKNAKLVKEAVKKGILKDHPWLLVPHRVDNYFIKLNIIVFINYRFKTRDITNMVKLVEDGVKEAIGIDDSFNLSVRQRKIYNDIDKKEYMYIKLRFFEQESVKWRLSDFNKAE